MRDPTKNLGQIGSAVLTFIGYKQAKSKCGLQYKPHQERDIYITHQDKGYLYNKTRHSYI